MIKSSGVWLHESNRKINRITSWAISVTWQDGTEQVLADVPEYVAQEVDQWLTQVEEDNTPERTQDE